MSENGKSKNKLIPTVASEKGSIDYIGIGSAKSGSSWVARCLVEHPDILLPKEKSLFFFNDDHGSDYVKDNYSHYSKGLSWYLNKIPNTGPGQVRGEFGVSYLTSDSASRRIEKHFPDVKIIVTLRNPVDMVYSLYWYADSTVEIEVPSTFEEAVGEGLYLERGKYHDHLKHYFDRFPTEHIHVILLDSIKNDSKKEVYDLYKFLGVSSDFVPSILNKKVYSSIGYRSALLKNTGYLALRIFRKAGLDSIRRFILDHPSFYEIYSTINIVPKKYPPMSGDMRDKLTAYYKDDVEKVEKLIRKDLSSWR